MPNIFLNHNSKAAWALQDNDMTIDISSEESYTRNGMPGPRVEDNVRYFTTTQVANQLGVSWYALRTRLLRGVLPPPTIVRDNGLRLFDEKWLEEARKIIELERKRNELRKKRTGSLAAS